MKKNRPESCGVGRLLFKAFVSVVLLLAAGGGAAVVIAKKRRKKREAEWAAQVAQPLVQPEKDEKK